MPQRPPSYYQYELAGILVHTGTADYGHYYSYIKERIPKEKDNPLCWYQFNDTVVEPFDEEDIPKSCFGGADQVTEWDPIQSKQVTKWKPKYEPTLTTRIPPTFLNTLFFGLFVPL